MADFTALTHPAKVLALSQVSETFGFVLTSAA
jgi:hypothetical protein